MVLAVSLAVAFAGLPWTQACTNVLVSPGAGHEGVAMVGANDDSSRRHGLVTHFQAEDHVAGDMREIWHFETGELMGSIPQPKHTYNVMGHANDQGVVIGETTHGGLRALSKKQQDSILDYGSLIWVVLQRSATAREAIKNVVELCNTYGYVDTMEGFSITDGKEVWYMELIGKGESEKGIVWVALRVPEGYITAHANQARIRTFLPCIDSDTCMAAPDAVTFAIKHGFYNGSADDVSFSFSDTYDPVTAMGARACEARVWYMFSQLADPSDFDAAKYLSYAQGFDLENRMPLFVKAKNVSRADIHAALSSHYEGSWLDPTKDVGAGPEHSPYRWNGQWTVDGKRYINERVVGTQSTGWHYVAMAHGDDRPAPLRAVVWWGSDDHTFAPKVPLFGGSSNVHRTYDDGNCSARLACRKALGLPGNMMEFSWDSAFWVNSAVANLAYGMMGRAAPAVCKARASFDAWASSKAQAAEQLAMQHWNGGDEAAATQALTDLAVEATGEATRRWTVLWQELMVSFSDGHVTTPQEDDKLCGCHKGGVQFSEDWGAKVVADTGDHYRQPGKGCDYIDDDGHCHQKMFRKDTRPRPETIPKYEIEGVFGASVDGIEV